MRCCCSDTSQLFLLGTACWFPSASQLRSHAPLVVSAAASGGAPGKSRRNGRSASMYTDSNTDAPRPSSIQILLKAVWHEPLRPPEFPFAGYRDVVETQGVGISSGREDLPFSLGCLEDGAIRAY